jgi:predicted permease
MDLTAFSYAPADLTGSTGSERVLAALVSGNYFEVLGVTPVLGRAFVAEEDRTPDTHPVAVISYRCWQQHFKSDAGVAGRTLKLNNRNFTIIGVAPRGFAGTVIGSAPDVWVPAMMWQGILELPAPLLKANFDARSEGFAWLSLAGRVAPGESIQAVRGRLKQIHAALQAKSDIRTSIEATALQKNRLPRQYATSTPLLMTLIFAVVMLLLLIACANVASLLLGRAVARRKELAIRVALGAGRTQIMGEVLTEAMILAGIGGGIGILISVWSVAAIEALKPVFLASIAVDLHLDLRVLTFTGAISAASGLLVGLMTAVRATSIDPGSALKDIQAAAADRRLWSARKFLVVGQFAFSMVLLTGAGLLLKTFLNLQSISVGFDPRNLILLNPDFTRHGYSDASAIAAYPRLLDRIKSLPGVESASLAQYLPLTSSASAWSYEGIKKAPTFIDETAITPGYFQTMGIPLLRGRDFNWQDRQGSQKVAIVNEAYARIEFNGADPIGLFSADGAVVIGLVKDTRHRYLYSAVEPRRFVPFAQHPEPRMSFVIRTVANSESMVETVRRAVLEFDPATTSSSVRTMSDQLKALLWQPRIAAILAGVFALLATALAVVGVYGAVAFDVSRRLHEIGVRVALGADRIDVLKMVLARGAVLGSIGSTLGICMGMAATPMIAAMLYEVTPADPTVFAGAGIMLVVVTAVASLTPALRATRVNTTEVLRNQ